MSRLHCLLYGFAVFVTVWLLRWNTVLPTNVELATPGKQQYLYRWDSGKPEGEVAAVGG